MYFQFLIEDKSTEILINHVMEKIKEKYPDQYIDFNIKSFKGIGHLSAKGSLQGLSEINSKNYDIILGKVKSTPITPVMNSSMSEYPDNAYNIKTEIKQQQKHLSNNEVLEIISKYKAGKSTYELAKEYGCHRRTISDNLKKRGIKVTNQLMERKGVVELVMQMYSEYYKPADIAKAVGINVDSVRKILKENNVYIRKSWEYPRK